MIRCHQVNDDIESPAVVGLQPLEDQEAVLEAGLSIMSLSELSHWLDDPEASLVSF